MRFRLTPHVLARDSYGNVSSDRIVAKPPCWGSIEPLISGQRSQIPHDDEQADYRITLRARNDLKVGDRLHHKKSVFAIAALVSPSPDRRRLTCLCRKLQER